MDGSLTRPTRMGPEARPLQTPDTSLQKRPTDQQILLVQVFAVGMLSVILTAPLGAMVLKFTGPKLLTRTSDEEKPKHAEQMLHHRLHLPKMHLFGFHFHGFHGFNGYKAVLGKKY
jgi:hypothetical protein